MNFDIKTIRYMCCICVLVATVILSGTVLPRVGFAQQTPIIVQAGSTTVEPNGTVVVPITIEAGSNTISAITMSVSYDETELTVSDCTFANLTSLCNAASAGSVFLTGVDVEGVTGTVIITELTIEAGDLAAGTVSDLAIQVSTLVDSAGISYVNRTLIDGQITVSPATATPTTVPPTDTPATTDTPAPTDTPATNRPDPTETLVPTSTAIATNTLVPTDTSTPSSTLVPTTTASPTATLPPTADASATPTPVVTATSSPIPTTPTLVPTAVVAEPLGLGLNATLNEDVIELSWTFQADRKTIWFRVYRSDTADFVDAEEVTINFIPVHFTGTKDYEFLDSTKLPSGTHYYWVEQVLTDTSTKQHGPASIVISTSATNQGALYLPIINNN